MRGAVFGCGCPAGAAGVGTEGEEGFEVGGENIVGVPFFDFRMKRNY